MTYKWNLRFVNDFRENSPVNAIYLASESIDGEELHRIVGTLCRDFQRANTLAYRPVNS